MLSKAINRSTAQVIILFIKLLLIYLLTRVLFNLYYRNDFTPYTFSRTLAVYAWGLRMDAVIIFLANILFIVCYFFLYVYFPKRGLKMFLTILFLVTNSLCIALNILDTGYYHFNSRRSTVDLFYVFSDSLQSMPGFIKSYWWLFVIFAFLIFLLYKSISVFFQHTISPKQKINVTGLAINVFLLFLVYLCFRLPENKMINATSPLVNMDARYLPLAQNSPFTVFYSAFRRQHQLQYKKYLPDEQAAALFPVIQTNVASVESNKKNVVVFILESFSRSYLTPGSPLKAHTPFFDSIIAHSTYFNNIFAQERSSNKGLVSILGSLPPFTDEPFFHSYYANTFKKGVGHTFKENGYSTNFFYGTEYDHFGFKRAMNMLGVDNYFCREDYDNKDFYDGGLGMYDEPWLQYMAGKLNRIDTPFLAIEFNVSSHWPYNLPASFLKEKAVPGQLMSQQSITYVDYAFSKMFEQIKDKPWFNNTIFVFCADHWFLDKDETAEDIIKSYEIPLFFYEPSKPQGQQLNTLGGQIDVLPTLYSKLGFKQPFTSFGKNLLDTSVPRYAFNHLFQNGIIQVLNDQFVLGFNKNDDHSMYLYNYKTDSLRKDNLINTTPFKLTQDSLELQIKALIQQFNKSVLSGTLTP
jgi:phosphoglycerol transferase MdoB-like AlkP superfamily enzyme